MARLLLLAALIPLVACGQDAAAPDAPDAPAATEEPLTADEVADRMLARYAATLGAVDGFTVEAGGAEARYTLADDTTGLERFNPPQIAAAGDEPMMQEAQLLALQVPNVPRLAAGLRTAIVEGPISRDGRQAYVFTTDDPGTLIGTPGEIPLDPAVTADLRVYVSAETFDVIEVYQAVRLEGDAEGVTSRLIYSDIREADGVALPWSVRQIETGLNAGISDDEKMIRGGSLGLQRQQLNGMPPGPARDAQLAQLDAQQRLIAEGIAEASLEVDAVRVGTE